MAGQGNWGWLAPGGRSQGDHQGDLQPRASAAARAGEEEPREEEEENRTIRSPGTSPACRNHRRHWTPKRGSRRCASSEAPQGGGEGAPLHPHEARPLRVVLPGEGQPQGLLVGPQGPRAARMRWTSRASSGASPGAKA